MSVVRGRPPGLAGGISGTSRAYCSSLRACLAPKSPTKAGSALSTWRASRKGCSLPEPPTRPLCLIAHRAARASQTASHIKSDWGCVRAHDKRDWAHIRRDWLAINYHGLTLDASEDNRVDRLSHEPPTAAGRKLATRSGFRTKISAREFLTGIGCRPLSPAADAVIGQESGRFAARLCGVARTETLASGREEREPATAVREPVA